MKKKNTKKPNILRNAARSASDHRSVTGRRKDVAWMRARAIHPPEGRGRPGVGSGYGKCFFRLKIQGESFKGEDIREKRDERRTRASWDQRKVFGGTGESYRGGWCASKGSGEDKGGVRDAPRSPSRRRRENSGEDTVSNRINRLRWPASRHTGNGGGGELSEEARETSPSAGRPAVITRVA